MDCMLHTSAIHNFVAMQKILRSGATVTWPIFFAQVAPVRPSLTTLATFLQAAEHSKGSCGVALRSTH